ncbi:MAG: DMT family transporter [Lachnospiraceae bacterium]|jgi:drug/metabolite transporter (DMT)-like permease|nr:DMT family transporter [Lachnospiraceae bacterium]MCI1726325.1 DMT family transporter [Lachnospiraceae bacterium]
MFYFPAFNRARSSNTASAYTKYLFSLLLFGSNGIIAGSIRLESYQIILLRTFLGSLLLLMVCAATHSLRGVMKHKRELLFVILSGVCMGISWMFQYEAYRRIGIGITSLLYCLGPILVVILARVLFREGITLKKGVCLAAVTIGAILTGGVSVRQGANAIGILCALMCAFAYAGMILLNKKNKSIAGLSNPAIQLTAAFATALLYSSVRWLANSAPSIHLSSDEWLPVLLLGLVNTGIGCYLYFSSIPKIPAQTVAVCDYIEPLSAFILAALILHESISGLQIAGAVLIVIGAAAWNIVPRPRTSDRALNLSGQRKRSAVFHVPDVRMELK